MGIGGAAELGRLWGGWEDVVGASVAAHTEPTSLRGGVLRVRADSPVWATELGYLADEVCRRANDVVGGAPVREVRVWTGPGGRRRARKPEPGSGWIQKRGGRTSDQDPEEALRRARRAWDKRRFSGR